MFFSSYYYYNILYIHVVGVSCIWHSIRAILCTWEEEVMSPTSNVLFHTRRNHMWIFSFREIQRTFRINPNDTNHSYSHVCLVYPWNTHTQTTVDISSISCLLVSLVLRPGSVYKPLYNNNIGNRSGSAGRFHSLLAIVRLILPKSTWGQIVVNVLLFFLSSARSLPTAQQVWNTLD